MIIWTQEFLNEFEDRLKSCLQFGSAELTAILTYQFYPAGKRIRPLLLAALTDDLLAAENTNNNIVQSLLNPCCALEMLHTASLIHDDLPTLDNDLERRGRATLHVIAGPAKALLAGDLLISRAFLFCSTNSQLAAEINNNISGLFSECFCRVCDGQVTDIENSCSTEQEVLDFYDLKTGALFYAAFEAARMIATAFSSRADLLNSSQFKNSISSLGKNLGRAFQVRNDLLEVDGSQQGRTSDHVNQRKTIFSLRGLEKRHEFLDFLIKQTWDTVSEIEKSSGKELSRTRNIIEALL